MKLNFDANRENWFRVLKFSLIFVFLPFKWKWVFLHVMRQGKVQTVLYWKIIDGSPDICYYLLNGMECNVYKICGKIITYFWKSAVSFFSRLVKHPSLFHSIAKFNIDEKQALCIRPNESAPSRNLPLMIIFGRWCKARVRIKSINPTVILVLHEELKKNTHMQKPP